MLKKEERERVERMSDMQREGRRAIAANRSLIIKKIEEGKDAVAIAMWLTNTRRCKGIGVDIVRDFIKNYGD